MDTSGNVPYSNNAGQIKYGGRNSTMTQALYKAVEANRFKGGSTGASPAPSPAPGPAPSPAPSPGGGGSGGGNTYVNNITISGLGDWGVVRTTTRHVDAESANAEIDVLRKLAQAKGSIHLMAITLTYLGTTAHISDRLVWTDEYSWSPVDQATAYSTTGALLVDVAVKQAGRPITLVGTETIACIQRALCDTLQAWASLPGIELDLVLRGVTRRVLFDHARAASPHSPSASCRTAKSRPRSSTSDF